MTASFSPDAATAWFSPVGASEFTRTRAAGRCTSAMLENYQSRVKRVLKVSRRRENQQGREVFPCRGWHTRDWKDLRWEIEPILRLLRAAPVQKQTGGPWLRPAI